MAKKKPANKYGKYSKELVVHYESDGSDGGYLICDDDKTALGNAISNSADPQGRIAIYHLVRIGKPKPTDIVWEDVK